MTASTLKTDINSCWPTPDSPTPQLVAKLAKNIDKWNKTGEEFSGFISSLRREVVSKPQIFVGTGTCGLGAGAGKTIKVIKAYLEEGSIDADIIEVGCIGICSEEPIVDVQLPGRARISFRKVTEKKVSKLLDSILASKLPEKGVLGQFRDENAEAWENAPYLDQHPFFRPQTRWVLPSCGIINPGNLDEYIATR